MDGKPGNIRHERGEATSQHPDKVAQALADTCAK
jgi:hypothetical protein